MLKRSLALLTSAALAAGVLSGCSSKPAYEIELYDGNYSEIQLVHKMVELLVEDMRKLFQWKISTFILQEIFMQSLLQTT